MNDENPYSSPTPETGVGASTVELEPPQSVKFQLTEEEVLAVTSHVSETNGVLQRRIRRGQRRLLILAAGMAALSVMLWRIEGISSVLCVMLAVLSATYCVLAFRLPKRSARVMSKLSLEMLNEQESDVLDRKNRATLFAEGFEMADQEGHSFRNWSSVPKIEQIENILLVYASGASAHPIPSRAFFDESAFESYCRLAERLWQEAHPDASSSA